MARLILGNTSEPSKDGKRYDWTFYVRGEIESVDSVTIKLHPTFKDPVRVCQEPPFEFRCRGWGTFDIAVLLKFRDGTKQRTTWELQLEHADASKEVIFTVQEPVAPWEDVYEVRGSCGADTEDEAMVPVEAPSLARPPPELPRLESRGTGDEDPNRAEVCERLRATAFLPPKHPQFMFGRGYAGPLKQQKVLWKSDQAPRKDHSCPKWLTATEYEDVPEVGSLVAPCVNESGDGLEGEGACQAHPDLKEDGRLHGRRHFGRGDWTSGLERSAYRGLEGGYEGRTSHLHTSCPWISGTPGHKSSL